MVEGRERKNEEEKKVEGRREMKKG